MHDRRMLTTSYYMSRQWNYQHDESKKWCIGAWVFTGTQYQLLWQLQWHCFSLQGQFQVYIRVSHRNSDVAPNFTPPFTDDLIDNIIIEANLDPHPFEDRGSNNLQVEVHQQSGGRAVINLGLAVYCAENFFGLDCNCRDTNDTSGHFTCDQNGIKTCNDGYTDPATNCTQCIPEDGCCKH